MALTSVRNANRRAILIQNQTIGTYSIKFRPRTDSIKIQTTWTDFAFFFPNRNLGAFIISPRNYQKHTKACLQFSYHQTNIKRENNDLFHLQQNILSQNARNAFKKISI